LNSLLFIRKTWRKWGEYAANIIEQPGGLKEEHVEAAEIPFWGISAGPVVARN